MSNLGHEDPPIRLLVELQSLADSLLASDRSEAAAYAAAQLALDMGDIKPVGEMRSISELAGTRAVHRNALAGRLTNAWAEEISGNFMPAQKKHLQAFEIAPDRHPERVASRLRESPLVARVYANPRIRISALCLSDGPYGGLADVQQHLAVDDLEARNMDGAGVRLAVVDVGVNADYLSQHGVYANLATSGHYVPAGVVEQPGEHPVDHGTMCAFDAKIAAPNSLLIDSAALRSTGSDLEAWLDDAIAAYDPLLAGMQDQAWPALVVSNSWAIHAASGDLPRGDPGNYGDNPEHLFNQQVRALEASGADIVFAAGNCGVACSPDCCGFGTGPSIVGANALPSVLTVGACDLRGDTTGYSSSGPGSIHPEKPDIVAWSHFAGSGVYPADNGTSAACPVTAGVIAAIRSSRLPASLPPARLRAAIRRSALPGASYSADAGYGRLDVPGLLAKI